MVDSEANDSEFFITGDDDYDSVGGEENEGLARCDDDAHVYASTANLFLSEGCALVDTAAGHPTCGGSYFETLEAGLNKCGPKNVVISSDKASIPIQARGVGGVAQTREVRLIPMRLGNITVFCRNVDTRQ